MWVYRWWISCMYRGRVETLSLGSCNEQWNNKQTMRRREQWLEPKLSIFLLLIFGFSFRSVSLTNGPSLRHAKESNKTYHVAAQMISSVSYSSTLVLLRRPVSTTNRSP